MWHLKTTTVPVVVGALSMIKKGIYKYINKISGSPNLYKILVTKLDSVRVTQFETHLKSLCSNGYITRRCSCQRVTWRSNSFSDQSGLYQPFSRRRIAGAGLWRHRGGFILQLIWCINTIRTASVRYRQQRLSRLSTTDSLQSTTLFDSNTRDIFFIAY